MNSRMVGDPVCVAPTGDVCGEGAVWHAADDAVYWTDINRFLIHRFTPADQSVRTWFFHETAEIIAQQKELFREQFGREPGPDDPLFFEPSVADPQFLSDESTDEIWKSLLQAAGDSGIDPAIVYAMNKTGRIVTETNVHPLTAELREWNDAVDEYHQKVEAGETQ
jgi:hypothetical protein